MKEANDEKSEAAGVTWPTVACRLCVSILKQLRFNADESLFGMFDGGHNSSVPHVIVNKMPDVLRDAMMHHEAPSDYMKYAMLAMHRSILHSVRQPSNISPSFAVNVFLCYMEYKLHCAPPKKNSTPSYHHELAVLFFGRCVCFCPLFYIVMCI